MTEWSRIPRTAKVTDRTVNGKSRPSGEVLTLNQWRSLMQAPLNTTTQQTFRFRKQAVAAGSS
jgi:hypothetical protein